MGAGVLGRIGVDVCGRQQNVDSWDNRDAAAAESEWGAGFYRHINVALDYGSNSAGSPKECVIADNHVPPVSRGKQPGLTQRGSKRETRKWARGRLHQSS